MVIKNNLPWYDANKDYNDLVFSKIAQVFCNYPRVSKGTLFCIIVLCPGTVCSALLIDVLVINKFYYFYKTLWLIIFPMIISYILYSIQTLVTTNLVL